MTPDAEAPGVPVDRPQDVRPPLLRVESLQTSFLSGKSEVRAVNSVSFELKRGETLGIVGESGSGKSVLALSMMRLVSSPGRIIGGSVHLDGRNLLDASEAEMRRIRGGRIAMVFQDPMTSLNPVLTVGRQITESVRVHKGLDARAARQRAIELLDLVGIPGATRRLDDYPHQFSGGMRQRVMIAIALACDPELLIADEPTTALDVTIQAQILELIDRLKKELGTAVILITHDLGVVAGMTDRVMVMYAGRVVEEAPTAELFAHPRMPYTMGLLRSIPRLDAPSHSKLQAIRGAPPDVSKLVTACPFHPRCDYFVTGTCDAVVPPLRLVRPEHRAACLFDITMGTPPLMLAPVA